jgi:hypothetical protein
VLDQAYQDKLDGKSPEDYWERKMTEWTRDKRSIDDALTRLEPPTKDRLLSAQRTLELASKDYSLRRPRRFYSPTSATTARSEKDSGGKTQLIQSEEHTDASVCQVDGRRKRKFFSSNGDSRAAADAVTHDVT